MLRGTVSLSSIVSLHVRGRILSTHSDLVSEQTTLVARTLPALGLVGSAGAFSVANGAHFSRGGVTQHPTREIIAELNTLVKLHFTVVGLLVCRCSSLHISSTSHILRSGERHARLATWCRGLAQPFDTRAIGIWLWLRKVFQALILPKGLRVEPMTWLRNSQEFAAL